MQLSDFGVAKQQTTLNNGVPLVVFERPGMPISIKIAFFNGSRFDPVGKEGLAHFAEHMIVSGSKKYPTKHEVGLFVESLGASFNASTSADKMDVYIDYAVPNDSRAVIDLLDQFLLHSLFDLESIERERGAIMAELAGKKSDPGVYIYRLWKQVAYQQNKLARDTIGSDESLLDITRDDLMQYYTNQLESGRSVVVASGDITASKLAQLLNAAEFVKTRKFSVRPIDLVQRQRTEPIMIKHYPNSEQTHVAFGFPTVAEDHADYWPLYVLSRILGAGRTSRLHKKLRNELGLVYSAHAGIDSWYGCGSIAAYTSCKTAHVQPVLDTIANEMQLLALNGVPEEELAHRKNFLTKMQLLRMQTSAAWVGYHTDSFLKYPEQSESIAQDLAHINAVTSNQVQAVAQKYFKPGAWYLAVCGGIMAEDITVNF